MYGVGDVTSHPHTHLYVYASIHTHRHTDTIGESSPAACLLDVSTYLEGLSGDQVLLFNADKATLLDYVYQYFLQLLFYITYVNIYNRL